MPRISDLVIKPINLYLKACHGFRDWLGGHAYLMEHTPRKKHTILCRYFSLIKHAKSTKGTRLHRKACRGHLDGISSVDGRN
jgi:hypothetical protein